MFCCKSQICSRRLRHVCVCVLCMPINQSITQSFRVLYTYIAIGYIFFWHLFLSIIILLHIAALWFAVNLFDKSIILNRNPFFCFWIIITNISTIVVMLIFVFFKQKKRICSDYIWPKKADSKIAEKFFAWIACLSWTTTTLSIAFIIMIMINDNDNGNDDDNKNYDNV